MTAKEALNLFFDFFPKGEEPLYDSRLNLYSADYNGLCSQEPIAIESAYSLLTDFK
jgi:hypothetical protein